MRRTARRRQTIESAMMRIEARRRPSTGINDDEGLAHGSQPRPLFSSLLAKPKSQVTRNPHAVCDGILL
jgi:hypothetical protein